MKDTFYKVKRNGEGQIAWVHYLLVMILFCATIFSFFAFAKENQVRISGENQKYAYDAAIQTANRVEDMLEARSTSLDLLSIAVSGKIEKPWIGPEFLMLLQKTSIFDYVEFIDADGLNHNANGITSDSSDRDNYLKGIRGETGFHVIYNSRITHETLINFYTPIRYRGEIFGVLNGMFRERSLRKGISVRYFDEDAKTLICTNDGTIISSYGYSSPAADVLDNLAQDNLTSEESLSMIQDAFAARDSFYCTIQRASDNISVSLVPIGEDWMLVQTFPAIVTRQMEANANSAGIRLELRLLTLFLFYVAYLIITNLRKRRKLTWEKIRLNGIVEGMAPLFARLVIIEPEQESYEYLKGTPFDLTSRGDVAALADYMAAHYLLDEDEEPPFTLSRLEKIKTALGGGAPFFQYEYRIRWDGRDCWENVSVLSLQKKDGVPLSLLFAIQDVTALQRQKDTIQQTMQDAFQTAEDMSRAKSDFLARMSHDMRTPMNAVLGMASIALSHPDDTAQVQDCLEKISTSGRQLLGLINEILDMSKVESGGLVLDEERFDLTDKLSPVLDAVGRAAAEKGLRLDIAVTPFEHRAVHGDPERFQQVLQNLLDNAVKYTPSGGTVTFRAQELPSRALKSGYYEFIVEDTGVGIDPSLQSKIFEPFVRGESYQDNLGTGLGLSIAQAIIKLMSGDIDVESEPGQGSKFTVHMFFKLDEDTAPDSSKQTQTGQTGSEQTAPADTDSGLITRHAGTRVLVVEDIAINMLIIQKLLGTAGLLVETAENGAEAVDLVQKKPPSYYSLIFMDLQMPVMDGYEASRTIRDSGREDLRRIPIVAVTANAFQEDFSHAKDSGMNDLVMKPVDLDRLLAALDKWLPKENPENETAPE